MTREEAIEVYNGLTNTKIKEAFEFFATELAESEDEMMEKAIVDALLSHCNSINLLSERGYQIEDVKAWLKKQKEQKPICKTEPIVDGLTEFEKQVSYLIASAMDKEHEYSEGYVKWMAQTLMGHAIKNQKPVWSDIDKGILKDAITAVDLLGNDESYKKENPNLAKAFRVAKDWLKSLPERFNLQPKQEWSKEDEKWFEEIELMVLYFTDDEKYREKFISWLKSLKNKGNFPKSNTNSPSWSEEDEEMIGDIISSLRGYMCLASKSPYYTNHETHIQKEIEFLNALRPHWKPSKEQILAIVEALKYLPNNKDEWMILNTLIDVLRKLM